MSVTTWNRLEPIVDETSVAGGLEARTADPLWMLGRQWQIGELTAEDAGTPISATVQMTSFPLVDVRVGEHVRPFDPAVPLEAVVEAEPPTPPDLRLRLRAGAMLCQQLQARGATGTAEAVLERYAAATPDDGIGATLLRAMGRRAADAERVYAEVNEHGDGRVLVVPSEIASARGVLESWLGWYRARTGRLAPTAWREESSAYQFELRTSVDGRTVRLAADSYAGGRLDWSDFRVRLEGGSSASSSVSGTEVLLPAPIDIPGGPARRFFELEDTAVNFNLVAGGPTDLATTLLAEVALIYGGDWFVIPVAAPVGSLVRIEHITVTDTFGRSQRLSERTHSEGWRMFELTGDDAARGLLLVLPAIGASLDGPAIEEVQVSRDEGANLVWAIERVLADDLGLPMTLPESEARAPEASDVPRYTPFLRPPDAWHPLVRRGRVLRGARLPDSLSLAEPRARVLASWPELSFNNEDVPADGLSLSRRWQYAIARDGRRFLWLTRSRRPGAGGAASHRLADVLAEPSKS